MGNRGNHTGTCHIDEVFIPHLAQVNFHHLALGNPVKIRLCIQPQIGGKIVRCTAADNANRHIKALMHDEIYHLMDGAIAPCRNNALRLRLADELRQILIFRRGAIRDYHAAPPLQLANNIVQAALELRLAGHGIIYQYNLFHNNQAASLPEVVSLNTPMRLSALML